MEVWGVMKLEEGILEMFVLIELSNHCKLYKVRQRNGPLE
jgi:hypothetical protein